MDRDAAPDDRAPNVREVRRRSSRSGRLAAVDLLEDNAAKATENTADNISSGPR